MGEVTIKGGAIDGVTVTPLRQIPDERGMVMHMLREDSPAFRHFGEIYFSVVRPGAVKAWKRHLEMYQNFAVPVGGIKLVIYDNRAASPTSGAVMELFTGIDRYALITIPPLVWYGFQGVSAGDAMIANCATIPHRPDESERMDERSAIIPYSW